MPRESNARKVVVAFDKFKGSLTATEATDTAAEVLAELRPEWQVHRAPFSDGGEGFCSLLTRAVGGEVHSVEVTRCTDRLGRQRAVARVGIVDSTRLPVAAQKVLGVVRPETIMVLDMATVDGLQQVAVSQRDPMGATTLGTGQALRWCASQGADRLVVGVGGSATNDLGLGALGALGLLFLDPQGNWVDDPFPRNWPNLRGFAKAPQPLPPLLVACDVDNPLRGARGASRVYGPQKGLSPEQCVQLDTEAARLARGLCRHLAADEDLSRRAGAGAAGGLAFGLMVGVGAQLVSGFELVYHWLGVDTQLRNADLLLTGEGCFDASSWYGKGPGTLLRRAAEYGVKSCVFAGSVDSKAQVDPGDRPLDATPRPEFVEVSPPTMDRDEAMAQAKDCLRRALSRWLKDRAD